MADAIACTRVRGGFVPTPRFKTIVDEKFAEGAVYWLNVEPDRSDKTHNHEFAWLNEAWKNLPEAMAERFPSSEHLRKRALIEAGYYDEKVIDVGVNAAALRVAAFARSEDEFAAVIVRGPVVVVRKAKSQSRRAMGAADFQTSKQAILEIVAEMIGVKPEDLARNAGRAA
jgi:hypothetical protein